VEESQEEGSNNSLVGLEDTFAAADVAKIPDKSASIESEDSNNLNGVKETSTSAEISVESEVINLDKVEIAAASIESENLN